MSRQLHHIRDYAAPWVAVKDLPRLGKHPTLDTIEEYLEAANEAGLATISGTGRFAGPGELLGFALLRLWRHVRSCRLRELSDAEADKEWNDAIDRDSSKGREATKRYEQARANVAREKADEHRRRQPRRRAENAYQPDDDADMLMEYANERIGMP